MCGRFFSFSPCAPRAPWFNWVSANGLAELSSSSVLLSRGTQGEFTGSSGDARGVTAFDQHADSAARGIVGGSAVSANGEEDGPDRVWAPGDALRGGHLFHGARVAQCGAAEINTADCAGIRWHHRRSPEACGVRDFEADVFADAGVSDRLP